MTRSVLSAVEGSYSLNPTDLKLEILSTKAAQFMLKLSLFGSSS